jgi:hypothetical protein
MTLPFARLRWPLDALRRERPSSTTCLILLRLIATSSGYQANDEHLGRAPLI